MENRVYTAMIRPNLLDVTGSEMTEDTRKTMLFHVAQTAMLLEKIRSHTTKC